MLISKHLKKNIYIYIYKERERERERERESIDIRQRSVCVIFIPYSINLVLLLGICIFNK